MADIILNNDGSIVMLKFDFTTPQAFFYTVEVLDEQGQQKFHSKGSYNDVTSFNLGSNKALIGLSLTIFWTIIDPDGAGNTYFGCAGILENNVEKDAPQVCTGITKHGPSNVITIGQFKTNNPM